MPQDMDEGRQDQGDAQRAPRLSWQERERTARPRGVVLDTTLQPPHGPEAFATVYEPDVLLVRPDPSATYDTRADAVRQLDGLADVFGWKVTEEPLQDEPPRREEPGRDATASPAEGSAQSGAARAEARRVPQEPGRTPRDPGAARTIRVRIAVSAQATRERPVLRPDAWRLLLAARTDGIPGVSLNHVLTVDPLTGNPLTGNPLTGNPLTGNPLTGNPLGIAGYAVPGFGGRQPVTYTGPAPIRPPLSSGGRRPVVAVLDTGCGEHPWLGNMPNALPSATDPILLDQKIRTGKPLGLSDSATDPEANPSLSEPLDGHLDPVAGHGTFIAGLVLQACPEAQILPIRVSDGTGTILENDLLGALGRVVELLELTKDPLRIDVMNLSFGFSHESPGTEAIKSELYDLLRRVRATGCVVVCSAGNEATDRPTAPAALYGWGPDSGIRTVDEAALAPQVAVGALNPSGRSMALFSNFGDWVTTYVVGVSVLSTLPVCFDGGIQAGMRDDADDRRRETLDLDDFAGGFAVWSGTSFAAPIVAGRIAHALGTSVLSAGSAASVQDAVNRVLDRCAAEDLSHT